MRLTLRTLLAYLDDILEPSQTKEIGTKLTESKFATGLVDRIREVIRRRRLTAPEVLGKSANDDPNVVAEYLDNTLSPDKVAEFEKVCLESDVQLAEAAACHQILTLVLGEPVEIRNESRRRMYTLVGEAQAAEQAAQAKTDGSTKEEAEEELEARVRASNKQNEEEEDSFTKRIPDYLRPRPVWQRAIAPILIFTVLGLGVALAVTDKDFRAMLGSYLPAGEQEATVADAGAPPKANSNKRGYDDDESTDAAIETAVEPSVEGTAAGADQQTDHATTVADAGKEASPELATATEESADTSKPEMTEPVEPAPSTQPSPVAVETPAGEQPAEPDMKDPVVASLPAKVASPETATPAPPQPMPAVEEVVVAPEIRDVSTDNSVLLRLDAEKGDWFVVSRTGADPATARLLNPEDLIAAPDPYDSHLNVGQGTCQILLRGGTSVRLLGPTPAGPFGIDVQRGYVVISAGTSASDDEMTSKPLKFGLMVRGVLRRVELIRSQTICGIEVIPGQPEKLEQDLATIPYDAKLHLAAGGLRLQDASGPVQSLLSPGWLSLVPKTGAEPAEASTEAVSRALAEFTTDGEKRLSGTNRWLHTQPVAMSITARKFSTQFLREFEQDQPLRLSIAPVVRDGNPLISELAVKTLALTENYPVLVKTLGEVSHEESLNAAIEGLRDWLPLSPDNAGLLKAELAKVFHPATADVVYRQLWGFSQQDAQDRDISLQLVGWLEHDELAVRQLAFYHIQRLTGQKHRYQADLSPTQRMTVANRLKASVEKYGGLVRKSGPAEPN